MVVREFLDARGGDTFAGWGFGSSEEAASGESTRDSPEAGIFHERMSRGGAISLCSKATDWDAPYQAV